MRTAVSKHPLVAFFLLAFSLSWIAVLPLVLNPAQAPEPFLILGALVGPTLSALIVLGLTEGRSAFRPFLARYLQWRAGLLWWLIVLFGALVALTIVAAVVVGPQLLGGFMSNIGRLLPTYLITLLAGTILGPLWEEPGWRGFALPRLQGQYGPLAGALVLGFLWALWHAPGFFGGWLGGSPLALLVSGLAFSIIMSWVYNNTRGSILLMILLHSSSSAAISVGIFVLPSNLSAAASALVNSGWIPALTYSLAALVVVLASRGRLSFSDQEIRIDPQGVNEQERQMSGP
jgi:membrane protease YdiL (CAAX protease family)